VRAGFFQNELLHEQAVLSSSRTFSTFCP